MQIITIDGPAASGKGTIACILAKRLGLCHLDSGAIYRTVALLALREKLMASDVVTEDKLLSILSKANIVCLDNCAKLNGEDVTLAIRDERVAIAASNLASRIKIRQQLLKVQRSCAKEPGLVADGRDMGSVVFKTANLKIFLTSSLEVRAKRRYEQLQQLGKPATMSAVLQDIALRDKQDSLRDISPLTYDSSFLVVDNSAMTVDSTINLLLHQLETT